MGQLRKNPAVLAGIAVGVALLVLGGVRAGKFFSEKQQEAKNSRDATALVFGLFDAVGPYRKNGLVEIYGASLRERRSGPISVTEADVEITHGDAWVIWSPDYSPARDATHLVADFVEQPKAGEITVGLIFGDGSSTSFTHSFGPATPTPSDLLQPMWPDDVIAKATKAPSGGSFQSSGARLVVPLQAATIALLRADGQAQIAHWFVRINGAAGTTVRIRRLGLMRAATPATATGITLSGLVRGAELPPGTRIELLRETGQVTGQTLALDGRFAFIDLEADKPVSIRVRHPQLLRYATLGRWFVPAYSRDDLAVEIRPAYVNLDSHPPDPKTAKFIGARQPSPVAAFYEPHSRQYWPGASTVQEYDSTTFVNNHGYVDRDRFFDNPDRCVRLASTGGSDMVALQVRPFEKANILLEESLGVALGKCVEVISAATDNGDIGTNYPRIRDYTSKFDPAYTLVSTLAGLVWQVSPRMLRDGLGIDHENSAFPNFYYDKAGKLAFRIASPVYPAFTSKPTYSEYVKGIPFGETLNVPFGVMPEPGREAFRYWTAIVEYIGQHHPGQKFIFHSGVEQAQCRKACESTVSLEDGRKFSAGAKGFVRNFTEYCATNHYTCINPSFSDAYGGLDSLLTYQFDGHYSPLGHQWLAEELTGPLARILKSASE